MGGWLYEKDAIYLTEYIWELLELRSIIYTIYIDLSRKAFFSRKHSTAEGLKGQHNGHVIVYLA